MVCLAHSPGPASPSCLRPRGQGERHPPAPGHGRARKRRKRWPTAAHEVLTALLEVDVVNERAAPVVLPGPKIRREIDRVGRSLRHELVHHRVKRARLGRTKSSSSAISRLRRAVPVDPDLEQALSVLVPVSAYNVSMATRPRRTATHCDSPVRAEPVRPHQETMGSASRASKSGERQQLWRRKAIRRRLDQHHHRLRLGIAGGIHHREKLSRWPTPRWPRVAPNRHPIGPPLRWPSAPASASSRAMTSATRATARR